MVSNNKYKITLIVPSISIDEYKGKEPWKSYDAIKSLEDIE